EIYYTACLADGGIIARLGRDEYFLESGFASEVVPALDQQLASTQGHLYRVQREDATFMLVGPRAIDVLSQTCACNFEETPDGRVLLTRLAGVSCAILPNPVAETITYRIWVDPGFAFYLWETLVKICAELGGLVIGVESLFGKLDS
ncbi:MAG: hypothetical protein N2C12_10685, partial [Planctomycetales bacterium]